MAKNHSSLEPWEDHHITEMEICQQPCTLTGAWVPYEPVYSCPVLVERVGQYIAHCKIRAKFRTEDGEIIYSAYSWQVDPKDGLDIGAPAIGQYDPQTPVAAYPTNQQAVAAATATKIAFAKDHVSGSFTINGQNNNTIGATEGTVLDIQVEFQATSPFAEITEMRILDGGGSYVGGNVNENGITCATEDQMDQSQWEPFAAAKLYKHQVHINWGAFSIAVQYKDKLGNTSPVYCDILAIEGMSEPNP
jgi:hypothetical protein